MTELTSPAHRAVRRRVLTARGSALVVQLSPEGIYLREAGKRTKFLLPYGVAFVQAARIHVDNERRAKAAARKTRRLTK